MDLKVMGNADNEPLYDMTRKESKGLKIVELKGKDCEYFDFVLVNYHADSKTLKTVKELNAYYKPPCCWRFTGIPVGYELEFC